MILQTIIAVCITVFIAVGVVSAATTIGTNIITGGTLSVTGTSSLGIIDTGTWNGSSIGLAYGGIGADISGIIKGGILTGTGAGSMGITTIGSNGQVLTASSTATGGIAWSNVGNGDLLAANNLSDLASAATARTNLGLAIGSDVQAYDAGLQSISGLVTLADTMIYTTGSDTYSTTALTVFARTILDDADASTVRTTIGLGNVEDTAISTWTGSTNLTTLGTIVSGTWNGTAIDVSSYTNLATSTGVSLTGDTLGLILSEIDHDQLLNFDASEHFTQANITTVGTLTTDLNINGQATTTASNGNIATQGSLTIGAGTAITQHLSATASVDFPVISANSCNTQTMTVTGAADSDTLSLGVPNAFASASSTVIWSGWVSASDTVSIRACQTGSQDTADFAAGTFRADIWKH